MTMKKSLLSAEGQTLQGLLHLCDYSRSDCRSVGPQNLFIYFGTLNRSFSCPIYQYGKMIAVVDLHINLCILVSISSVVLSEVLCKASAD